MGRAYQNRKESIAKTSDAKAKVYSKYGREIYMCAKAGGLDPAGNDHDRRAERDDQGHQSGRESLKSDIEEQGGER